MEGRTKKKLNQGKSLVKFWPYRNTKYFLFPFLIEFVLDFPPLSLYSSLSLSVFLPLSLSLPLSLAHICMERHYASSQLLRVHNLTESALAIFLPIFFPGCNSNLYCVKEKEGGTRQESRRKREDRVRHGIYIAVARGKRRQRWEEQKVRGK